MNVLTKDKKKSIEIRQTIEPYKNSESIHMNCVTLQNLYAIRNEKYARTPQPSTEKRKII